MDSYEQKYKEALAKAREVYHKTNVVQKGLLENIFPELKESEDERTRKALIAYFQNFPYDTIEESGTNPEEAITWLEKQGELKSSKWTEGDVVRHGGILALVTNGRRAMKSNCEQITIQYPDEWVKADPKERKHFFEELEKQSKQKPQGKSAYEAINEVEVDNANKIEPKDYNSIDPHFAKPINKVEPTAWSEEDALRKSTLTDVVKSGGSIRVELRNEFVDWLKSLKDRIQH